MIISESGKYIFCHIQKTAGTSIEKVLVSNFADSNTHWHGRHGQVYLGINDIGKKEWKNYFSFAIVRNPWDRMVSWYSMIEKEKEKLSQQQVKKENPFASTFWNYAIHNSSDFESFLLNCTDTIKDRRSIKSFIFNQVDYLIDSNGTIAVDFIGRFENLENDVNEIFNTLNIKNTTIPKLNESEHLHYSRYYNSKTIDLIYDRFERDIDTFNYKFEIPT